MLCPVALACTHYLKLSALWHHDPGDAAFAGRVRAALLDAVGALRDIVCGWHLGDRGASVFHTVNALVAFSGNTLKVFATMVPE